MMLKYSLGEPKAAEDIENAVSKVLDKGRTPDIKSENLPVFTTREAGEAVVKAINEL